MDKFLITLGIVLIVLGIVKLTLYSIHKATLNKKQ